MIISTWHTEPNPDQQKQKTTDKRGRVLLDLQKKKYEKVQEKGRMCLREKDRERVALFLSHPLGLGD